MINTEKLSAILVSYKKDFISHQWKDEKYKWVAVKHFQDHWDINATNFPDMFTKATEKTDNLLAAKNFYPKNMLIEFAKIEPETVRAMFMNLFNEAKELSDRVEKFRDDAEALRMKHNSGAWNQHYQNLNAISTYLWLRYPDKYYIYKYSEYVEVAKTLESSFVPKRSISTVNLIGGFKFYDEICDYLEKDYELVNMLKSVLSDDCYPDPALKTLTIDVGFYVSRCYSKDPGKNEDNWFPADYSPNITTDKWLELLADKSVFDINSLKIMKRMKDYGGAATCKQLSEKYGGTKNFYNVGSSALAKRIAKVTGCPVLEENNENSKWWPVLYVGRYADKDTQGSYIWKLRDELSEALDRFDLSEVPLFEEYTTEENNLENRHYWWLNANPKIWSFSNLEVGGTQVYTLYNENGNKRRIFQNFLDARKGDIVIGYEANPVKKIVALARVARENDGKVVYFEKTENLTSPIDYNTLKESPELQNMEFFVNPNGTLFKLTKDEFNVIIDIIREATL